MILIAKGDRAKQLTAEKLAEAFGENWIGENNKKYYIWANDGGERVQLALTITAPKVPIEVAEGVSAGGDWDFSDTATKVKPIAVTNAEPAELTQDEVDNIQALMARVGL